MLSRSTLLHLRLPFSLYLLPIYLFAISQTGPIAWPKALLVFFILHFLLYPASNGYNSYFDRDESSIGGLKKPPPVQKELYWVSLILDLLAILLGLIISWQFSLMLLIYGLVSKAYSHPGIRIKRYPWLSWLIAGFFQGFFTFVMTVIGVQDAASVVKELPLIIAALLSSLMLWGSYPMTQIYQHQEDLRRGDITLSQRLGVLGTFHFTAACFLLASSGFFIYFINFYHLNQGILFLACMLPVVVYFGYWYVRVRQTPSLADFDHTMRLNLISSICLCVCFLVLFLLNH